MNAKEFIKEQGFGDINTDKRPINIEVSNVAYLMELYAATNRNEETGNWKLSEGMSPRLLLAGQLLSQWNEIDDGFTEADFVEDIEGDYIKSGDIFFQPDHNTRLSAFPNHQRYTLVTTSRERKINEILRIVDELIEQEQKTTNKNENT